MIGIETNAAELAAALRRYAEALPRVVGGTLRVWVTSAADAVRVAAPEDTGALKQRISGEAAAGPPPDAFIRADGPYAAAQEFGSGTHGRRGSTYEIRPRFKRALRFPAGGTKRGAGQGDTGYAFAAKVDHPGVEAQPYFFDTIRSRLDDLQEMTAEALDTLADRIGLSDRRGL